MEQGEQLIRKARHGDAEAFIQLMEDNKESMKRIAYAYLKQDEDAADAIQDTILDAFEHIHKLRKEEYFKTWLTRILINNCTRIYRQNKRHRFVTQTARSIYRRKGATGWKPRVIWSLEICWSICPKKAG